LIDYHALKDRNFPEAVHRIEARDVMLYALGLGCASDPADARDLRYVFEKHLRALPTMAAVLAPAGFWMREPGSGIDWVRIVHGQQAIKLHAELPTSATVIGRTRLKALVDKGRGRGALIVTERTICEADSGMLLATVEQVTFARGDGGFSEEPGNGPPGGDPAPPPAPDAPASEPQAVCELASSPRAALVYRLSGDYNPLHADPEVARAAGFPRPILHGLATFGIAGRAILRTFCDDEPARMASLAVRFSAPVFPGETVRTEMWRVDDRVMFRARALGLPELDPAQAAPGRVVLSHGVAGLR
jgi:acyl dehydratase